MPHCRNSSKICHTVGTVPKYGTLSEQFQNMPHCRNSSKIWHTVGTVPKYATLSEQFQNMPHCRNSSKIKSKSRIKRDKMDTTHFPDLIIKNGGVNLVL
jgi:hypothetical protein